MKRWKVVCERCGYRHDAPATAVWPVTCGRCYGNAAPSWWFRENNPDRKPVTGHPREDGQ